MTNSSDQSDGFSGQVPDGVPGKIDFEPAEQFLVEDLDTLKVLADPLRLRILELMDTPATVKQVAAALDLPPTKLYYHINLLEKHRLIVVVETRIVSGIIEKRYQVAARYIQVADHLLSPTSPGGDAGMDLTVTSLLEDAKTDLLASLREGAIRTEEDASAIFKGIVYGGRFFLTDEQAGEFFDGLRSLIDQYESLSEQQREDANTHAYKTLVMAFPSSRAIPTDNDTS